LGIGDWGLGIGDWAQSPIPNPQSPIPRFQINFIKKIPIKFIRINFLWDNQSYYTIIFGDWGLGIGDWGLGPIPNPQSPIPNPLNIKMLYL